MYAVPNDTKLLVFTVNHLMFTRPGDRERFELFLSERTGIPCVVLNKEIFASYDDERADFFITPYPKEEDNSSSESEHTENQVDDPCPVLDKQPNNKRDDGNNHLGDCGPRCPDRSPCLHFLKGFFFFASLVLKGLAFFILGALVSHFLIPG